MVEQARGASRPPSCFRELRRREKWRVEARAPVPRNDFTHWRGRSAPFVSVSLAGAYATKQCLGHAQIVVIHRRLL